MTEPTVNRLLAHAGTLPSAELDSESSSHALRFRRVLVPVDFSVCPMQALHYARAEAADGETMIHVLHVIPLNIVGEEAGLPRTGLIRAMSETARQELHKLVGLFWDQEIQATVEVRPGLPHQVIVEVARATQAELIVLGKRSQTWFSHLWRRDTVARVLEAAPCPVLVVRPAYGHPARPSSAGLSRHSWS